MKANANDRFRLEVKKHLGFIKQLSNIEDPDEAGEILRVAPKRTKQLFHKIARNLSVGHFDLPEQARKYLSNKRGDVYALARSPRFYDQIDTQRGGSLGRDLADLVIAAVNCPRNHLKEIKKHKHDAEVKSD